VALVELDVRVGGRLRVLFGGAEGTEHEVQGVYREVVPNRRLVLQHFDEQVRDGHRQGWSETFVKLETYLKEG
jgi:uncharacterized protein YndB with AHSA1/START domain